mgnify:CR=1 FL=1
MRLPFNVGIFYMSELCNAFGYGNFRVDKRGKSFGYFSVANFNRAYFDNLIGVGIKTRCFYIENAKSFSEHKRRNFLFLNLRLEQ